jgi:hypothetical protein
MELQHFTKALPIKINLLEQVRHAIRIRHYNIGAEEACLNWIKWTYIYKDMSRISKAKDI